MLGAVAPVVFRARAAEARLEGRALTPEVIEEAAAAAAAAASPIDDRAGLGPGTGFTPLGHSPGAS